MKKLSSLTIFFPAYNDANTIPLLVARAKQTARAIATWYEILVIDDGSTDNTRQVLAKLQQTTPGVVAIHHPHNLGYGAAIRSGFAHAKGEFVFYTDGDGQYDPRELVLLAQTMGPKIDVVNGYKLNRSDPPSRILIGKVYTKIMHILYPLPISDITCDFRLIRRSFLQKISLTARSALICVELIAKLTAAGARFAQVGVHHYPRRHGRSTFFRIPHLVQAAREHWGFYWEHRY